MDEQQWARRVATWLPRLAEPADAVAAAEALYEISSDYFCAQPRDDAQHQSRAMDTADRRLYGRALDLLGDEGVRLIPLWVGQLLELLRKQHAWHEQVRAASGSGASPPEIDIPNQPSTEPLSVSRGAIYSN